MGLEIQDMTIYSMVFADDQLQIAQDYEDLEYMTRKLTDEYELWGFFFSFIFSPCMFID